VGADEGTQQVQDGVAVGRGVLGDAFQRVDTANAHVDVFAAQLIHRASESLGDLAFAADVDLPPGCHGADDDQQPGKALQDRGPGVVSELGLRLLELDAHLRAGDTTQVGGVQRRVEPPRDDNHAYEQDCQQTARCQNSEPGYALVHDGRSPQNLLTHSRLAVRMPAGRDACPARGNRSALCPTRNAPAE
jgi:hypothetical protein